MSEHKSDGHGGRIDDGGRRYTTNDGQQASHGTNTTVYDAVGNPLAGIMHFGHAVEKK